MNAHGGSEGAESRTIWIGVLEAIRTALKFAWGQLVIGFALMVIASVGLLTPGRLPLPSDVASAILGIGLTLILASLKEAWVHESLLKLSEARAQSEIHTRVTELSAHYLGNSLATLMMNSYDANPSEARPELHLYLTSLSEGLGIPATINEFVQQNREHPEWFLQARESASPAADLWRFSEMFYMRSLHVQIALGDSRGPRAVAAFNAGMYLAFESWSMAPNHPAQSPEVLEHLDGRYVAKMRVWNFEPKVNDLIELVFYGSRQGLAAPDRCDFIRFLDHETVLSRYGRGQPSFGEDLLKWAANGDPESPEFWDRVREISKQYS
jgi:hypothetical protein